MKNEFDVTITFNRATCNNAETLSAKILEHLADDESIRSYSVRAENLEKDWFVFETIVVPFEERNSNDAESIELCDKKRDEINSKINELIDNLQRRLTL